MILIMDVIMGVCWSIAYVTAIMLGIKHRTWCFPALAICQNFSWEFLMVIHKVFKSRGLGVPFVIQAVWLILDVGILLTWFFYDRRGFGTVIKKIALMICVALLMYQLTYVGGQWLIMSFLINAIMSAAFIWRRAKDKSAWTSPLVGIMKLIGTLAATIGYGILVKNTVVLWIGGLCLLFDAYYLLTLYQKDYFDGWLYEKE